MMAAIDGTAVIVSFPSMVDEFRSNLVWVGWVITGYSLVVGIVLPLIGRVTELAGQRRAFLGAAILFMVGSLGCAMSSTVEALVIWRLVQGLGGGAFMPLGAGIVSDHFGDDRSRMIGLLSSFYPLGGLIGPNVGGLLVGIAGWRSIFLINVPICLLVLSMAALLLTNSRHAREGGVDVPGAALMGTGILALMSGLTLTTESKVALQDPAVIALIASGVIILGLFIWWEGRAANPIVDLNLMRRKPFIATNVLSLGIASFVFAANALMPLYATRAYSYSASEVGLLLTPRAVVNIFFSASVSMLLPRLGFRPPLVFGFLTVALTTLTISLRPGSLMIGALQIPEGIVLTLLIMLGGIGMGFVLPSVNTAGLDLAPDKVTLIAGMRGFFSVLGQILSTTIGLLIISLFADEATGIEVVYRGCAVGILAMLLLVPMMPSGPGRQAAGWHIPAPEGPEPLSPEPADEPAPEPVAVPLLEPLPEPETEPGAGARPAEQPA